MRSCNISNEGTKTKALLVPFLLALFALIFFAGEGLAENKNYNTAKKFMELKMYPQAEALLLNYIKENPKDAPLNYLLANCYIYLNDIEKADFYFKKAIVVNTDYAFTVGNEFKKAGIEAHKNGDRDLAFVRYTMAKLYQPDLDISEIVDRIEDPDGVKKLSSLEISSKFVENVTSGRIFVITGELRNDYTEPRSFIKVHGSLFDKRIREVGSEIVYAGNFLSNSVLQKANIGEIKNCLKYKYGNKNQNVKIKPSAKIPFMIVFSNIDDSLDEFNIKVVGSVPYKKNQLDGVPKNNTECIHDTELIQNELDVLLDSYSSRSIAVGQENNKEIDSIDLYRLEIAQNIQKNWSGIDRSSGGDYAVASVSFKVMKDGKIVDIFFVDRSGNPNLDDSAYKVIVKSSPVKSHPENLNLPFIEMGLRFSPEGVR